MGKDTEIYKRFNKGDKQLEKLLEIIDQNIEFYPDILVHISGKMKEFQKYCKKQNDSLMINALGSACQILAMKKRPSDKEMKKHCVLIQKAQFPKGLESWHHQGEKNFYNRFLKDEDDKED